MNSLIMRIAVYACAALFFPTAIFSGYKLTQVWSLNRANTKLQEDLKLARADLATALELNAKYTKANEDLLAANQAEHQARTILQAALNDAVSENKRVTAAAWRAAAAKRKADAERDRALTDLKNERALIYASNADCNAWGRALMCGPLSTGLRTQWGEAQRAAGDRGEAGNGGGGASALRQDPGGTHGQASTAGPPGSVLRPGPVRPGLLLERAAPPGAR